MRGLLTGVWDDANNQTSIVYDAAGRKTSMTDPDMGTWSYGYDLAGNLISQTDGNNQTILFSYDRLNRLVGKDYAQNGLDASYSYDACANGAGQRCSAGNSYASASYIYDELGRLSGETRTVSGLSARTATYQYDQVDRLKRLIYPDGENVVSSYDAGGNPYSLARGDGAVIYVARSTYRPWGALNRQQVGNGLWLDNDYDETGNRRWLSGRWVGDESGGQRALDLSYDYDAVGNVTAIDDALFGEAHSYAYDHRDRLTDWWLDGVLQQHYAYDQIGNIESFAGVSYSYSSAHPHAVSSTSNGGSFGYNNAGYMTSRRDVASAPTYSYLWWGNHKLRRVTSNAGNDAVWFYYGPDDERVRQLRQTPNASGRNYNTWSVFPFYQVEKGCFRADVDCDGDVDVLDIQKVASRFNTTYTAYEQDGANPISVTDITLAAEKWLWQGASSAQQVVKMYNLGGRTVAIRRGGELTYLFQDHLGSPALETDVNGNVIASHKYEPYGTMRSSEWTLPIDRGFTGQTIERGLGLHEYVARHYAQPLGRWIAPDTIVPEPSNPQSLNRYSYVLNSPLRYADPTGHYVTPAATYEEEQEIRLALARYQANWLRNYRETIDYQIARDLEAELTNLSYTPDERQQIREAKAYYYQRARENANARMSGVFAKYFGLASLMTLGLAQNSSIWAQEATVRSLRAERLAAPGTEAQPSNRSGMELVPYYPPNRGFQGQPVRTTLSPGTVIDRYGGPAGTFASPQGTPPWARSLPPGAEQRPLNTYVVIKPLEVDAGRAAPWFGQPGGGIQYDLSRSVQELIASGVLAPLQ